MEIRQEKGSFPSESIRQLQTEDGSIKDALYYGADTRIFRLPVRDMTDEDSITQSNDVKEFKEEQKKEEDKLREEIAAAGECITQRCSLYLFQVLNLYFNHICHSFI